MKFDYPDDSIALHTDAYQLTMMQTYWQKGIANRHVAFEAFSVRCRLEMATQFLLV